MLLLLCMLVLLPGCRQMRANRANMKLFRSGYARLQGLSSVYVRNEQYAEGDTNPEKIHSISKSEYYITPLDPEKTAQIIQTQYHAMTG